MRRAGYGRGKLRPIRRADYSRRAGYGRGTACCTRSSPRRTRSPGAGGVAPRAGCWCWPIPGSRLSPAARLGRHPAEWVVAGSLLYAVSVAPLRGWPGAGACSCPDLRDPLPEWNCPPRLHRPWLPGVPRGACVYAAWTARCLHAGTRHRARPGTDTRTTRAHRSGCGRGQRTARGRGEVDHPAAVIFTSGTTAHPGPSSTRAGPSPPGWRSSGTASPSGPATSSTPTAHARPARALGRGDLVDARPAAELDRRAPRGRPPTSSPCPWSWPGSSPGWTGCRKPALPAARFGSRAAGRTAEGDRGRPGRRCWRSTR